MAVPFFTKKGGAIPKMEKLFKVHQLAPSLFWRALSNHEARYLKPWDPLSLVRQRQLSQPGLELGQRNACNAKAKIGREGAYKGAVLRRAFAFGELQEELVDGLWPQPGQRHQRPVVAPWPCRSALQKNICFPPYNVANHAEGSGTSWEAGSRA